MGTEHSDVNCASALAWMWMIITKLWTIMDQIAVYCVVHCVVHVRADGDDAIA